jgi:hypothetical protein
VLLDFYCLVLSDIRTTMEAQPAAAFFQKSAFIFSAAAAGRFESQASRRAVGVTKRVG